MKTDVNFFVVLLAVIGWLVCAVQFFLYRKIKRDLAKWQSLAVQSVALNNQALSLASGWRRLTFLSFFAFVSACYVVWRKVK